MAAAELDFTGRNSGRALRGIDFRLAGRLRGAKAPLLLAAVTASFAIAAGAGWAWFEARRDSGVIAALLSGQNVEIDPAHAAPRVAFARAYYLLKRDRIEEAQAVIDQANWRADPATRVGMLYDMANTRVRGSFDAIERGDFDMATALIGLAKDEYTEALRIDPEAWNVRFNIDVASRLLRDLPEGQAPEEEPRESTQQLWTDLPGVPKGEP